MYLAAVLATALVACGGLTPSASKSDVPGGSYRGVGTGAGLESLTALAKRFEALHRGVTFKLEDLGADTSIALVANGDADFGFLSRDLKPEEKARLTSIPYAGTGTGLAVSPLNVIGALTKEQVRRIYAGEITDWSQVGGSPGAISVYTRNTSSGTYSDFKELAMPLLM